MEQLYYCARTGGFYSTDLHAIPGDAVEITAEQRIALLDGQAAGKVIVVDGSGEPVLADPPPLSDEALAAQIRARRDALLVETDWSQGRDVPDALATKWAPYRQALRDVPQQAGFPRTVSWPVPPA